MNAASMEEDAEKFVNMVTPVGPGEAFDVWSPKLRGCLDIDSVELATLFLKTVVHQKITVEMKKGKGSAKKLEGLCGKLLGMCSRGGETAGTPMVVTTALTEVSEICQYILTLAGSSLVAKSANIAETLQLIRGSQDGAKVLVKHASDQSGYWQVLEKEVRSCDVGYKTYGTELAECVAALSDKTDKSISKALSKLPQFLDNLKMPMVSPVIEALRIALLAEFEEKSATTRLASDAELEACCNDLLETMGAGQKLQTLLLGAGVPAAELLWLHKMEEEGHEFVKSAKQSAREGTFAQLMEHFLRQERSHQKHRQGQK